MTYSAIILVLLSTCLHAAWNMYSRKYRMSSGAFCIGGLTVCLVLLPVTVFYIEQLPSMNLEILSIIILSSLFQAIYFYGIANAYSHGSLSLSYPLLRSIPILMVLAYVLLIGEIETVTKQSIAAGFLIIIGCGLLPMQGLKDFKLSNYLNKMMIFVLIAAFGTAGYSIIDSVGVKKLAVNSAEISMIWVSYTYIYTYKYYLLAYC